MNRRSFFGFACGGVAAAPLALIGQGDRPHQPSREETRHDAVKINVDQDGNWLAAFNERMDASFAEHQRKMEDIRRENARNLEASMSRYSARRG